MRYTSIKRAIILDPKSFSWDGKNPAADFEVTHSFMGKPLLDHLIHAIEENGIKETVLLYPSEGEVKSHSRLFIRVNKNLAHEGPLGLLLEQEDLIKDDFVLIIGNQFFTPNILSQVIDERYLFSVGLRLTQKVGGGNWPQYRVVLDQKKQISELTDIPKEPGFNYLTTTGIWKIRGKTLQEFVEFYNSQYQYLIQTENEAKLKNQPLEWLLKEWAVNGKKCMGVKIEGVCLPFYSKAELVAIESILKQKILQTKNPQ